MPIMYVSGDLFVNRYQAQAFAHGCNCQGVMGKGIAKEFRERYPAMYQEYRHWCNKGRFNLGDVLLWKDSNKPWVFNLATQENYWSNGASYLAIEKALYWMRTFADNESIQRIAMPRIGAGFGGLAWEQIRELIEDVFGNWLGIVYVYEEYIAAE